MSFQKVRTLNFANGILTIKEQVSSKKEVKSVYQVAKVSTAILMRKVEGGTDEEVNGYLITEDLCTCKGAQRWGHCKHSDAAKKLLELGLLA